MKLKLGWSQDVKLCKNKHEIKVKGWSQNTKLCKNLHETQVNMAGLDDTRYKNKYHTEIKMVTRCGMVHCGRSGPHEQV